MAWTPPFWLRKLDVIREDRAWAHPREMSPEESIRLACELMTVTLNSLRRQADEVGCSVSELLAKYEQATAWLRARAT